MNAIAHQHQLLFVHDAAPTPGIGATPVGMHVEDLLPEDTHHGRDLFAAATQWRGDASDTVFVRVEVFRGQRVMVSALRYVGDGEGEIVSGVLGGADNEAVSERLRAAFLRASQVVVVGNALEAIDGLLDFGARIVERRSMLSVRAFEVGMLQALRDEAWVTSRRIAGTTDLEDPIERAWLFERAHSELCTLVASGGARASMH